MSEKNKDKFMRELANFKREMARKKVNEYFKEVIEPLLPNCKYVHATDELFDGVHLGLGSKVNLRPYNYLLENSIYYYQKPLRFIHYTSLNNCLNILREKSFRLYDLNCLDDKHEFLFASKKVFPNLSDSEIKYWKSNVFTLSMCDYELEKKEKSFETWRNYAQDGLGVGVVLKFQENNQREWLNRYLSKIYYNAKPLIEFVKRHNENIKRTYFPVIGDHQELILNLGCFHKNNIYKGEMEVRYMEVENGFDKPDADDIRLNLSFIDNSKIPIIYVEREVDAWQKHKTRYDNSIKLDLDSEIDLGKDKRTAHFRRLHLDTEFRNSLIENNVDCPHVKKYVNSLIPSIKIEKIILGYRYDEAQIEEIRVVLNEIATKTLGYSIDIEITKLKKYF